MFLIYPGLFAMDLDRLNQVLVECEMAADLAALKFKEAKLNLADFSRTIESERAKVPEVLIVETIQFGCIREPVQQFSRPPPKQTRMSELLAEHELIKQAVDSARSDLVQANTQVEIIKRKIKLAKFNKTISAQNVKMFEMLRHAISCGNVDECGSLILLLDEVVRAGRSGPEYISPDVLIDIFEYVEILSSAILICLKRGLRTPSILRLFEKIKKSKHNLRFDLICGLI